MITALGLGDEAPDFVADSTEGSLQLHRWLGDSWGMLFSHPKDFTPICTTELGCLARMKPQFDRRGCKILGLSVDPVADHVMWARDIEETQGHALNFPLIGDHDLKVAKLYGMLHPNAGESAKGRKAADNATVRTVFVIAPDKTIKAHLAYPMSTGRNFDEILRLLDSVQLTARHKVATPVNWKRGEDVVIVPSVSDEDARKRWPEGWTAPKPYMRFVAEPA